MPSKFLESLGIASPFDTIELERVLGISFKEFTPQHCDVWRNQTVYLYQYALTHAVSKAARMAGVTIYTAQRWQTDNILGFNRRMEVALLEFTDEVEVMLLEHVREPESSPMLLAMLLRAQMPEKYGPARRSSAPRDNHCDHDPQPTTSHDDQTSLADLRRELEDLKRMTGVDERHPARQPDVSDLSPTDGEPSHSDLSPTDPTPVGAGFKPASDLSPTEGEPSYSDLSPADGGPSYPNLSPTDGETSHPDLSPTEGETSHPDLSPTEGETSHPDLSPAGGETQRGGSSPTPDDHELPEDADLDLSSTDPTPVGAGFKPAPNLSPADGGPSHPNLSPSDGGTPLPDLSPAGGETQRGGAPQHPEPSTPNLSRRQRRELQRQAKRKHQKSRRARAPN